MPGLSGLLSADHFSHCSPSITRYLFIYFEGLVPKSEVQREAHEAAEHPGRPETRVLPRPEEDEGAGRQTRAGRAGTLLLLWR